MKIIVTTSNKYSHIIPIFCYLFNKNWDSKQEVELVGYDKPQYKLPDNFHFVSLGKQHESPSCFGGDLKSYFEKQEDWFIWLFEDTFIIKVDHDKLDVCKSLVKYNNVGRIGISDAGKAEEHAYFNMVDGYGIYCNTQDSNYRLSTQPSIWNKKFLLQYMRKGLTPWKFETQTCINDGWQILGMYDCPVVHNEGVRKHDLYDYDLNRIPEEQIAEMRSLKIL